MRISNQMISGTVMANLSSAMDRMYMRNAQASSGKRITKSSDDPVGTGQALGLRASLASVNQCSKNVDLGKGQLAQVDSALNSITQTLNNAKTAALSGANATTDAAKRQTLAAQIQQQIDSILQQVNTTYQGRHIFGGNKTLDVPVTADSAGATPYKYNGDSGATVVQVSDTTDIGVSMTAAEVLNLNGAVDPAKPDVLSVLVSLKNDLTSGDMSKIQDHIAQLDAATQNVIGQRAKMGTRAAQMDVYGSRLTDANASLTQQLSDVEDVDITEAITQLQTEQNVYQASLLVAARMSQQNLGDFLR